MTAEFALPRGFRAAGTVAGIKPPGRGADLGLLLADDAFPAAAVFTKNALVGAHVPVCREHLDRSGGRARAVLVNSGNANCATGARGLDDARALCASVAAAVECPVEQVLCISTGVIGAPLPRDTILTAIPRLVDAARSGASAEGLDAFARAIMTTDTHPKVATTTTPGVDGPAQVTGVAKGSGMIHPDLATMLGFLLTDGRPRADLGYVLRTTVDRSFHRVSVDGDTSPNDTVLLWSSARTECVVDDAAAPDDEDPHPSEPFGRALVDVGSSLCRMIAKDGEGASRLVTVQVRGATSERDAAHVGRLIATSPLSKTAITGRDPNWGRFLSVAGRAGVALDVEHARVWVGDAVVYEDGRPWPEREAAAHAHLTEHDEVVVGVDLAVGPHDAEVWTCDLTADYVRINADYRT